LLKLWTQAPLKKLRNFSLSLRRGPWRLQSKLWGLKSLKLALGGVFFERSSSSNDWTMDCLVWEDFDRGE
jgi:hypothetical protein